SDRDAERLAVPNAAVVPNGYDEPVAPLGRAEVGDPPTILLTGLMTYPPNADAARWLTTDIAPRVREQLPAAQVRLVGRADQRVTALGDGDRVVVTGWVEEIDPELARADVVAVPVRFGGGTRIKVLEAFAHRIPVVSTTLGVEGLDVEAGRELLIADD